MAMFLTTGSVFVDVGANIGLHSLYAKQLIGCEGKLYCFEASKKTFKILSENIEMNGFLGVETYLYHNAVSSKNGQVEFHNFEHHAGMSSIKITKERLEKFSFDKGISETVDALTLDSVKNLRSAGKVDLVKIDVENFEYEVLLGMKEIIKSSPNIKIILEFLPYDIIEIHGQTYFKEMLKFMINNFSYIYEISQPNGGLKTVILNEENMHGYDLLLSKISCI